MKQYEGTKQQENSLIIQTLDDRFYEANCFKTIIIVKEILKQLVSIISSAN